MTPDEQGITPTVEATISKRPEYFAARFTGYFAAEQDGVYTFSIGSNDGGKLTIGGRTLDNDGLHSSAERSLQIGLKQGYHPISIEYFQAGGSKELYIKATGPGLNYDFVPTALLFHD